MTARRGRLRVAMIGIVGSIMAFGVFGGFSRLGTTRPRDPYDAIPKASFIAATIDFAELRRSPLYAVVFGVEASSTDPLRRALGIGRIQEACGFDPAMRVQKLAVSIPEEGDRGDFGVAARVEVSSDELERCTKSLADKRGGRTETREVGTFVVLEDKSLGGAASPRLAYGKGGLLIVGKATWFDAMLGAADRKMPGLHQAKEHVALRASLTSHDGFRAPTVLFTAILPRSLRERLKGEMGAEIGNHDVSNAAMAGVLGIEAVGIALRAGGSGENVDASAELVCESPEACDSVEELLKKKRAEWSRELALRILGLGPLLDSLTVQREGTRLRVTATAQADGLAATVERLTRLRSSPTSDDVPPQRPAHAVPDETIPARPDAGAGTRR